MTGKKLFLPVLVNPTAPKSQGAPTTATTPPATSTSTMEKYVSLSKVGHQNSNTALSFLCLVSTPTDT